MNAATRMPDPALDALLACPVCKGTLARRDDGFYCAHCDASYGRRRGALCFLTRKMYASDAEFEKALAIEEFWGKGWERRLADDEHAGMLKLEGAPLRAYADRAIETHRINRSIMIDAIATPAIGSTTCLNIGSGAGSEALILATRGSRCIALDITSEAAVTADGLLQRIDARGAGIQADARYVPIASGTIDFIYSSGVLHHSPEIERSVAELHRVLKPGGRIYIMLYATWSILFLQPRIGGFLRGNFSRARQHEVMSANTEGDWRTESRKNPHTVTFTRRQVERLFGDFRNVVVAKRVFSFRQIRFAGRVLAALGLVPILDRAFRFLDPLFGACLFIEAEK
jgi:SAM-dependent methyltransferase